MPAESSRLRWALGWGLALAAAGCAPASPGDTSPVASLSVTRGSLEHHVLLTGELEAAEAHDLLVPRTDSWAISIRWLAEDGAFVHAGDRVAELDNTAILEQISDYELAVIQAGIELSGERARSAVEIEDKRFEVASQRIALAKAELDAQVDPELVSRREFQQFLLAEKKAATALATAEDDLRAAIEAGRLAEEVERIALTKARRRLDSADEQIDALVLQAPRDGVVSVGEHPWEGRKLQVGETVWPGAVVAKMPELQSMLVKAQLSDVDDGTIEAGMTAQVVVDAFPERPMEARVLSVSPVAREPQARSARRFFSVVLELQDADPEVMRPGFSVKADVVAALHEDVLLVPRVAVDPSVEPPVAWRSSGEEVPVELGACNAQHCIVLAGLEEGAALQPARVAG
ncbi:MAG: HlyD family efflux transporter periplasmic adaptor subunit [Myxococcota bacterium]